MSNRNIKIRPGNVIAGIHRGVRLMTQREKIMAVLLTLTSLLDGLLQTATIVAIIPIIQVMLDPSATLSGRLFSWMQPLLAASDRQTFLLQLAGSLAALVLFKGVFNWFQVGWMARFSMGCEVRLSSFMMERILKAPYAWLVRQNSARLRQLLFGFVSVWSRDFIRSLMKLMNDLIFVACVVTVLMWTNPVSGFLVAVIATVLGSAIFTIIQPKLMRLAETKRSGVLGSTRISSEAVFGVKDVKMAGAEHRFTSLFVDQVRIYSWSDAKAQQWAQLPRIMLEISAYGALMAISVAVIISGTRNPEVGSVVLLYGLAAVRLLPIFSTVVSGLTSLVGSFPPIADLEKLILSTQAAETSASDGSTFVPWREVRLDDASFSYHATDRPALEKVSLSIVRGQSYGVVGPSGAGKSTLIDVIAGLLDPTHGAVLVDGHRLVAEQQIAWRRRFGYVTQRPFLLDSSLRENITFHSSASVDMDRLQRAIVLAKLEKVGGRLPGGIEGRVGEQGAFLSGGERQRVAIARALYRGADILILDEATSSLDPLVEQEIAESIAALHGQVTTIIVSHRLGLVRNCDEIWVLEDGVLCAKGVHADLMRSSSLYQQMVIQSARSAHGGHINPSGIDRPVGTPPN